MFGVWDYISEPERAIEDGAAWLWDKTTEAASYLPFTGPLIAAGMAAEKANYVEAKKDTPNDALGAFEKSLGQTYEGVTDAALNTYAQSDLSAAVDTGLAKAKEVSDNINKKRDQTFAILDALTNPWVLGGIAVVVTLAIAGPYVLPFITPRR